MHKPYPSAWRAAVVILLAALFVVNIYRAVHQSIGIDEAFAFNAHINVDHFWEFQEFSAANHVLQTVLSWFSVKLLGLSEFTLRLPTVIAGGFYFAALFRMAALMFDSGFWSLLFIALNSLNPHLLDFMSAARGYGVGLAFFAWALVLLMEEVVQPGKSRRVPVWIGILLGLAVCAQLAYVMPAAAVAVVFLVACARSGRPLAHMLLFLAAGVFTTTTILVWPMRHAHAADFYGFGSGWIYSFRVLMEVVFFREFTRLHNWAVLRRIFLDQFALFLAAAIAIAACYAAALLVRHRRGKSLSAIQVRSLSALGVVAGSLAFAAAAHLFLRSPLPTGRAAVYFPLLMSLAVLPPLAQLASSKPILRAVSLAGASIAWVYVAFFVSQFQTYYYAEYRQTAASRDIFQRIGTGRRSVGASWPLADALNFYRVMYNARWLYPITRTGPDCYFDDYALLPVDSAVVARYDLEPVFLDPTTGAMLARPRARTRELLASLYPPPIQSGPPCGFDPQRPGDVVRATDRDAEAYFIRDVMNDVNESGARWTFDKPLLAFLVPTPEHRKLVVRFGIPGALYERGTPELTLAVNGLPFVRLWYPQPGEYRIEKPVPPEIFGHYRLTTLELSIDRHVQAWDGRNLGIYLFEAGFPADK